MKIKGEIGEEVYVKATIEEIRISHEEVRVDKRQEGSKRR